jgi:type III pantothenate kinase
MNFPDRIFNCTFANILQNMKEPTTKTQIIIITAGNTNNHWHYYSSDDRSINLLITISNKNLQQDPLEFVSRLNYQLTEKLANINFDCTEFQLLYASSNKTLRHPIQKISAQLFRNDVWELKSKHIPLEIHYDKPRQLGIDRLASAYTLVCERLAPGIIIDCGTATAITAVDPAYKVIPGPILPGLLLAITSLTNNTDGLQDSLLPQFSEWELEPEIQCKSTEQGIREGTLLAQIGAIKEIREYYKNKWRACDFQIFLTGGNSKFIAKHLNFPVITNRQLFAQGILYTYHKNIKNIEGLQIS